MKNKLNGILLVDDNESDNYLHEMVLRKADVANYIEVAINGKEALGFLRAKGTFGDTNTYGPPPDLILLDINMPVMDGWEFLEEYNKLIEPGKNEITFIVLTTSINPADRKRAEKVMDGGNFYYKPLTQVMIDEILQKYFPAFFS